MYSLFLQETENSRLPKYCKMLLNHFHKNILSVAVAEEAHQRNYGHRRKIM